VKDLVARAKTSPGSVLYGSAGNGSGTHLAGELFNYLTGARLVHVPYRGIPPALVDLLGGRLAAVFATAPTVAGYMADGRLKALAASTAERSRLAPDVPTMAEAGVAGYETALWYGVVAPRGTPRHIRASVADVLITANALPDVQAQLAANGAEPLGLRLDAFTAFIRDDIKRMKIVVDYAGISVE
jgi:tripartite-type tricarboxylate transporter receptor subunit TctC